MCQIWCPHWAPLSPADSWKVRELLEDSASLYPPFAYASERHPGKPCPSSLAPAPKDLVLKQQPGGADKGVALGWRLLAQNPRPVLSGSS